MAQDGASQAEANNGHTLDATGHRYVLDPAAAVWRELEDEIIVLELSSSLYLTLNGSARELWLRLSDGATTDELSATLVATYGIDEEQAGADAVSFLEELIDRSLVARVGASEELTGGG